MISSQTLLGMSQVDITTINPSTLVDVSTISISPKLPHEQKLLSVMEQIGNPYCFMSGDTPVRIRFLNEGRTLSDSLVSYFSQLKQR